MAIKLHRWSDLAVLPAHALRDRAHLAVGPGQQREDAVGLTVVELAEDDRVVAVGANALRSARIRRNPPWTGAWAAGIRTAPAHRPATARGWSAGPARPGSRGPAPPSTWP